MTLEEIEEELREISEMIEEIRSRVEDALGDYSKPDRGEEIEIPEE